VSEKPILFKGPLVRAILEGRKTVTRRIVKPQPIRDGDDLDDWYWSSPRYDNGDGCNFFHTDEDHAKELMATACPYGVAGDRLWVRESFGTQLGSFGESLEYVFKATDDERLGPWKPSIFMPRSASRLLLEIVSVRVERLQEISTEDACAEGMSTDHAGDWTAREQFQDTWDKINFKRGSWASNPWVWVITFRRVRGAPRAERED
jgi:hypothetical protein